MGRFALLQEVRQHNKHARGGHVKTIGRYETLAAAELAGRLLPESPLRWGVYDVEAGAWTNCHQFGS